MRRGLALLALALVAAAPASAAESDGVRVSALGGTRFPDRAFVVSLPEDQAGKPVTIRVSENGEPVSPRSLRVIPATQAGAAQLATVLAIDTSNSMRGGPIEDAMEAARAFALRRNATQQLAVVTFDGGVRTLLPFTRDAAAIDRALARTPRLSEGTRIYDAVRHAAAMLRGTGIEAGSIVLLSDGADVRSVTQPSGATDAARAAGARIFAVGLRSRAYDAGALASLSIATGGRYAEAASSSELEGIFDRLGFQLANEYLVRYRSLAGPEEKVDVAFRVVELGVRVETSYVTPALAVNPAGPYAPSAWSRFWRSDLTFGAFALLAMALVGFGVVFATRPSQNPAVRRRVGEFVSISAVGGTTPDGSAARASGLDRLPPDASRWQRFQEELEIAKISVPASQIVLWTIVGTMALGWLVWFVAGPIPAALALMVPLAVHVSIQQKLERQRRAFVDQLPDNLSVLAAALRAGHSLLGALSVVVDDAGEPSRTEFRRVIAEEQLGVPLEDAIEEVARRMDCRDLEQVALVAALGRDTGGNTAEVLDRVTDTIRERADLRRLVRTLTTQGRMSRWIVSFLPGALLLLITIMNPGYTAPLFEKTAGRLLLLLATVMVVMGSLAIRRIVNIKI